MNNVIASNKTQTTCPYCGVGCGVEVSVGEDQTVKVKGNNQHPANFGRLCVKGSSLHETLDKERRLLSPRIDGKPASWKQATQLVAEKFNSVITQYGPESVAFYVSGQLLTEDYYVANKLMKGFIGSANIDTNSRLCMSSAVAAHKRAFGSDAVPCSYTDLEQAELILMVGSNAAYAHPIVFQRINKAKIDNPDLRVVVLDPRRTATCDIADTHLPLRPGSDGFFFNGLLVWLADNQGLDQEFLEKHTEGFDKALAAARKQVPTLDAVAEACDIDVESLRQVYEAFNQTEKVVSLFSQGVNQSSSGTDKGNAIINCHLASGKIGKPGAAPFSITGQPNAMGGREVGGLANQLAAHMSFDDEEDIARVENFWQANNMARKEGLKAVDMFNAIHEGKIRAVWIMATNPVVSMPDANFIREALERCDFVVVSDCMEGTDTTTMADVLFPAATWGEKMGTLTNSERCVSLQKNFLPMPGEARPDWRIICDVANEMGFGQAFAYTHPVEIFREHATLSGLENKATRGFDISAYSHISQQDYENLQPRQWPINDSNPMGVERLYSDGHFFTPNHKAQLIAIEARYPFHKPAKDEWLLNTGRIRDQWHTMTRTGKASRLLTHIDEPFVQIHPIDAEKLGVRENTLVELSNKETRFLGKARVTEDQRQGELFSPIHWNSCYASFGRIGALVNQVVDPLAGQPEFKHTPVKARAYPAKVFAQLLVSDAHLETQAKVEALSDYWAKITVDKGVRYSLADAEIENVSVLADMITTCFKGITDWVSLLDTQKNIYRLAGFYNDKLAVVLMAGNEPALIPNAYWLESRLGDNVEQQQRYRLLLARDAETEDKGAIICSCYQVGENAIKAAVEEGAETAEGLGEKLQCGTNCGSCIPELKNLVKQFQASEVLTG